MTCEFCNFDFRFPRAVVNGRSAVVGDRGGQ
jgi:hypothetical protein